MPMEDDSFIHKAAVISGVFFSIPIAIVILVFYSQIFLLIFAGLLFAVFLDALVEFFMRWIPLKRGWVLIFVLLALFGMLTLFGFLIAPSLSEQFDELAQTLPQSFDQLRNMLSQSPWTRGFASRLPQAERMMLSPETLARVAGIFSTTVGALSGIFIVLFTGIYIAFEPDFYKYAFLRLIPKGKRARTEEVLRALGHTLRWWILGQLVAMATVGVLATIGLFLLKMPLALALGMLAGLLTFIPYLGPIIAGIPGVLLAFLGGPKLAFYVLLLYIGIQTLEDNLITPLVQRRAVRLPPVMTLFTQIFLILSVGFIGVLLATPIAAAALVLLKKVYVEDILDDRNGWGKDLKPEK